MGLSYFIVPDKATACKDDFPEGLSYFFQQLGGYGEASEVSQISNILGIDLSAFQLCAIDFEMDYSEVGRKYWQPIDAFTALVDDFIDKIASRPDYYALVRHDKDKALHQQQMVQALQLIDPKQVAERLKQIYQQESIMFPPDTGFLSTNEITNQLKVLKKLLDCFRNTGVSKIKLVYG